MTLTITESLQSNSLAKPGSTHESSESNSIQNPRSNPVCLEVPITIRSLPGEKGEASSESAKPNREEAKTVIVFDNGAVLRIAGNFPPGQAVILSNSQGRDVVCRVASARNLPTVKGFIEVEFVEPVDDFWSIHQSTGQTSVSNPPTPVLAQSQIVPSKPAPAQPAPVRVAPTVTQTIAPSGNAPSFEDIAGLVRMSPPPTTSGSALKAAPRPGAPKDDGLAHLVEAVRPASPVSVTTPAADPPPFSTTWESASVPVGKLSPSSDFLGKSILSSAQPSSVSSSSGSRGRMLLILAGAFAVLVGVGAGFFFGNRRNVVPQSASVPAVTQPSTHSLPAVASVPEPAANTQSVAGRASPLSPAVSPVSATSTDSVVEPVSSVSQTTRRLANNLDAKQLDRSDTQRQPIPDLKMSAPTAANRNSENLGDGSVVEITDVASTNVGSGVPAGAMLSPIGHTESQPAPPPLGVGSSGSSAKAIRDPKLISSTRPLYPELAKQSHIEGTVVVFIEVDASGNVAGTKATSGPLLLRQAALDAVRRWKYAPALINGKPAAAQATVNIDFHLNQ